MKSTGMKRCVAACMVMLLLLCGCNASQPNSTDLDPSLTEAEETEPETEEHKVLQKQLISLLNTEREIDNQITTSSKLDDIAEMLAKIAVEDPDKYGTDGDVMACDIPVSNLYACVYDGKMNVVQLSEQLLPDLSKWQKKFKDDVKWISGLSIAHTENKGYSVWLVLLSASDLPG